MQLRQTETFRIFDDHQARVRHIDADFDDGCRDQQRCFARCEIFHRALFLVRLQAPVHEIDAMIRQRARQFAVDRFGRLRLQLFGFFDDRADPIGLTPFRARGANAFDHFVAPSVRDGDRRHRRAAGRKFIDRRDIQIGVRGHRQRARNRRRGEHELMRHAIAAAAFVAQQKPLVYAEAVLLIDDDQPELARIRRLPASARACRWRSVPMPTTRQARMRAPCL